MATPVSVVTLGRVISSKLNNRDIYSAMLTHSFRTDHPPCNPDRDRKLSMFGCRVFPAMPGELYNWQLA